MYLRSTTGFGNRTICLIALVRAAFKNWRTNVTNHFLNGDGACVVKEPQALHHGAVTKRTLSNITPMIAQRGH